MAVGVAPIEWGFDATAGVLVVGAATAVALAWRRAKRRIRALRSSPGVRGAAAVVDALRTPGGLRTGGQPARLRVELWQAVSAATRAVRRAADAGAALGELPSLTRRLHQAAEDLDRLLSMASGLRPGAAPVAELCEQVHEVLRASESIRMAALASASDGAAQRVGELAADADREVQSVAAGVARSRAALSGP